MLLLCFRPMPRTPFRRIATSNNLYRSGRFPTALGNFAVHRLYTTMTPVDRPIRVLTGMDSLWKLLASYVLTLRFFPVGTGAVGAIYSWRLSKTCNITTVCRSNYEQVKKEGFDIDSKKFGREIFVPDQGKFKKWMSVTIDFLSDTVDYTLQWSTPFPTSRSTMWFAHWKPCQIYTMLPI